MGTDVPWPPTALLGRDHEVSNVADLVRAGDVRLVTITGPGGVGKTRLALEVAHRVAPELAEGAVFVDLSGVTDARAVAATIAQKLDVSPTAATDSTAELRRVLARREVLLVLDNYEQVLAAADLPAALVESCPGLCVLVTSRAPLRVRAERVFRLTGLPVPISASPDPAALLQFGSVELFCDRAAAIKPGFALDDDNAPAIADICCAVDGLPLAIELAAARISHLNPVVLRDRLVTPWSTARLATLGRGADDLPARQRTMRDTIAWSYDLLSPLQQCLLRRLSVFDGDCSLEAIEAVCSGPEPSGDGDVELDDTNLLDALAALVDLHLVEPDDRVPGEARFELLVTIREFGRGELDDAGQTDSLRSRHAQYYADLVKTAALGLDSPAAPIWHRRLEHELAEVRGTIRHLMATDQAIEALRVVTDAGRFWRDSGHGAEGRRWLDEFLDGVDPESLPPQERASALMWAGRLAMDALVSDDPAARPTIRAQLDEALALARSIPDEQLELDALLFSTHVAGADDEDLEHRISAAEDGIAVAREVNRWRLAELCHSTALLAHRAGHRERAAALAAEACALADELGHEQLAVEARLTLSFTTPGTTLAGTAPALADIVPRAEALGNRHALAWLYPAVASESLADGRVADAARWFGATLEVARDAGYWYAEATGMMGAQVIASLTDRAEDAARLYGALAPHLASLRRTTPPAHLRSWEQLIDAVRTTLGDDAFDAAARRGSSLSWDGAVEEAIAICRQGQDAPDAPQPTKSRPDRAPDELTDRELEVLRQIAAGGSNKDVAAALGITAKTVMHHSVAIYRKLGVRGRAEATAYAYRAGLVDSEASA